RISENHLQPGKSDEPGCGSSIGGNMSLDLSKYPIAKQKGLVTIAKGNVTDAAGNVVPSIVISIKQYDQDEGTQLPDRVQSISIAALQARGVELQNHIDALLELKADYLALP
ncbi:hypothetical protein LCGC14_2874760, partial [marine sediment metagenome]